MMSISCSAADGVSSGSWFIKFNILTLKVTMLTEFLHQNKFALGALSNSLNPGAKIAIAELVLCLLACMSMHFGRKVIFQWLFFSSVDATIIDES